MDSFTWLIVTIVILGVALGIAVALIIVRRGKVVERDGRYYLTFFIIGVSYLSIGIALSFVYSQDTDFFNFFTFLGIIFTAMGLSNIDKWRKKPE